MNREHSLETSGFPDLTSTGPPGARMSNLAFVTQSLALHMAQAHRIHAQSIVPSDIVVIPPDATVSPVEKDGRVTGVWVDAKVFVQLRPEK